MKVKQPDPPTPPIEREVLAEAIVRISSGVKRLLESGLNQTGIIVLLADLTGYSKTLCRNVLDGIVELEAKYCRPVTKDK